jgi:hypothetical protein
VRDHLFAGPIAEYFRFEGAAGQDQLIEWAQTVVRALAGVRSALEGGVAGKEILSAALAAAGITPLPRQEAADRLVEMVRKGQDENRTFALGRHDPLSEQIYTDITAVMGLEEILPRIQWLELLKGYLRIALASWVLASMKITPFLRDWCIGAADGEQIPSEGSLLQEIQSRHASLLRPTLTPSREVTRHVEHYVKARVELSIFLATVNRLSGGGLDNKVIVTTSLGTDKITLEQLLMFSRQYGEELRHREQISCRQFVIREAEKYSSWQRALRVGVGKNLDEFLRVLRKGGSSTSDPSGLLTYVAKLNRGYIVFPGPTLLKLFVFLAERERRRRSVGRRLILADVEQHFGRYGIDFAASVSARPRLIAELESLGLLRSSPDAGESAELVVPFKV